ncbi:FAD-dependent oxidoreductase [Rhodococcus fascians]|nr:FAD-dependent oxidoreductase [Rhodococcus fascians]MBY3826524.1 FAD-dependent oxidoreductase [Rhodococcus fascians]MBY3836985.1 FAD-dependent oxidoreductase [Rhodococcus fascians]MBY3865548.1 FAD-dependent oxidoreductase [Rhodococcus fascians]MBY3885667.1 FAD-dependent oxidoreductase [Rhodococcus fascians]
MRPPESVCSEFASADSTDAEVVVVGGGPVGLAAAMELSRRGLSVIVVRRSGCWAHTNRSESLWPSGRSRKVWSMR